MDGRGCASTLRSSCETCCRNESSSFWRSTLTPDGAPSRFFSEDIRRIIQRNLPGPDPEQDRLDAYQTVCEALLKNDKKRLRAYSGRGSPSGFILQVIENLVVDYARTIVPRRRLPASIERLSTLDQSVFRLLYCEPLAPDCRSLLPHIPRAESQPTAAEVAEAIIR